MPQIPILYQDEHFVAVSKPSGMFVHRTALGPDRDVLLRRVRERLNRHLFPVHRLDRPSSGVVLFGLRSEVARQLHQQLGSSARKLYLGLAREVTPASLTISRSLTSPDGNRKLPSTTHIRRIAILSERASLLHIEPRTGRRHQIRRHLAGVAHHLIGDVTYGKGGVNRLFRERYGLLRLALHALRLELDHPISGERMIIEAPVPEDLAGPLRRMPGFSPPLLDTGYSM